MAVKTKEKKTKMEKPFEERSNLSKLYLCFAIVNAGMSSDVIKIMQAIGCSACFVQNGTGTADETLRTILNFVESKKEVVIGVMRESKLDDFQNDMKIFFALSKKNKGISFAIPLSAIAGIKTYKFLSQTI